MSSIDGLLSRGEKRVTTSKNVVIKKAPVRTTAARDISMKPSRRVDSVKKTTAPIRRQPVQKSTKATSQKTASPQKSVVCETKQQREDFLKPVESFDFDIDSDDIKNDIKKEKANKKDTNKKTKKKLSNAEALAQATPMNNVVEVKNQLKFEEGAAVVAKLNNNPGVLVAKSGKNSWQVQFGSIKMTMKEKDLRLVEVNQAQTLTPSVSIDLATGSDAPERPVFELRLLGMRSDEAIHCLEHQIDLCALNNFPHFSVIHGKGDGILQQAVKDYLSHSPMVGSFEQAPAEDGGAGKTYVTLK